MQKVIFIRAVGTTIILFLLSAETSAQRGVDPIEVGGFLTTIDFRESVGEKPGGVGGRFTYNFTDNFALDSEVAYFPENPSNNFGQTVALAGLRAGLRSEMLGAFAKIRPGVAHFGGGAFRTRNGNRSNIALDVGGVLEFYPSRRVIVRVDLGDTIVAFGDDPINSPLPPYTIRPGTTHNFQGSFGIGFRF